MRKRLEIIIIIIIMYLISCRGLNDNFMAFQDVCKGNTCKSEEEICLAAPGGPCLALYNSRSKKVKCTRYICGKQERERERERETDYLMLSVHVHQGININ